MKTRTLPEIWELLKTASQVSEQLTLEDIERGLQDGTYLIFTRDNSAALVSRSGKNVRIGLAAGNMAEMHELEADIVDYATIKGYDAVEIIGRPGWERVLKDYERVAVILRKVL